MRSSIQLHCLCGHRQSRALDAAEYETVLVTPGLVYCDFVACEKCSEPMAFQLPLGVIKRRRARGSQALVIAETLRRGSKVLGAAGSTGTGIEQARRSVVGRGDPDRASLESVSGVSR